MYVIMSFANHERYNILCLFNLKSAGNEKYDFAIREMKRNL